MKSKEKRSVTLNQGFTGLGADMKIMYVLPQTPEITGYNFDYFMKVTRIHDVYAEMMTKRGHDVELIILGGRKIEHHIKNGYMVTRIPVSFGRKFGWQFSFPLYRYLMKTDADIIHIHAHRNPNTFPLLFLSKPIVIQNHGSSIEYGLMKSLFMRINAAKARKVLSVNRQEIKELKKIGIPKGKIAYLPDGFSSKYFHPMKKSVCRKSLRLGRGTYIIYVGRLSKVKGIEYLIESMSLLKSDATLLIAGTGSMEEYLIKMAREKRVNAKFLSDIDNKKLPVFYNAADICVFPSVSEGFGMVVIEAMACGRPVIGTTEHEKSGVINNSRALISDIKSSESLLNNINLLLKDRKLSEKLAKQGLDFSKNFEWEGIINRLEDIYMEVLEHDRC